MLCLVLKHLDLEVSNFLVQKQQMHLDLFLNCMASFLQLYILISVENTLLSNNGWNIELHLRDEDDWYYWQTVFFTLSF